MYNNNCGILVVTYTGSSSCIKHRTKDIEFCKVVDDLLAKNDTHGRLLSLLGVLHYTKKSLS